MSTDSKVIVMPEIERRIAQVEVSLRSQDVYQVEMQKAGLPECFGRMHLELAQPELPDPNTAKDADEWEAMAERCVAYIREQHAPATIRCGACAVMSSCLPISCARERFKGGCVI